ncbi:hypothetical protein [Bradyrhizobium japonicum]|uniref:hypothetical protein n=1 Tax=Bradyrhizobium japonicum TaxID=375 RepID=UPI0004BC16A9|nr:hypothetical protein [Bradyrhizobium japonicum]
MAKIGKSFSRGRTKQTVMEVMANRKRGLKTTIPAQTKTMTPEQAQAEIDAWVNSPEFAEECRKEEKQKRAEERRLGHEAELEAAREQRRRNEVAARRLPKHLDIAVMSNEERSATMGAPHSIFHNVK